MNHHLKTARAFANLMDNNFNFLGIKFGLDTIIGVMPGAGDLLTFGLSFYLIWIGYRMNLPNHKLMAMVRNVVVDSLIGGVPLIGDLIDVFYKANLKNLKILEEFDEGEVVAGQVAPE